MPLAQAQHHNSGAPYLSNTSGQYGQNLYTAEQTANANYSTPTYSQHSEMHTSPCHAYADILFYGNISRYLIDPVGILAPIGDSSSSYDEGADDSTHSSTSTSDTRRYCSQIPSRLNVRIEEDGVTFYKHLHSGNEHIQGIQGMCVNQLTNCPWYIYMIHMLMISNRNFVSWTSSHLATSQFCRCNATTSICCTIFAILYESYP